MAPKVKSQQGSLKSEAAIDEAFYRTFRGVYGTPVLKMLEDNYQNMCSFDADPLTMAYKEGQRSIFLQIKARMDAFNNRDVRKE